MAEEWTDHIDELVGAAADGGAVPGAVVVVCGPEGIRHESAAGRLEVGGDTPVSGETMFRFASMTKALATTAALQLAESGDLDLDAPVANYVPEFGELQVLDGFEGDAPRLRAPKSQATVRQLLNHTAGCGYWFDNADLLRFHEATGTDNPLAGTKTALFATPLVADPGTRWEYGTNTDWAGLVVEAVAGKDLQDVLTERVFGPLGMTEATFRPTEAQRARLMPIHHRTPDGGLVTQGLELPGEPEFWPGGHGCYGTARDYARFLMALLNGGELDGARILASATVDDAFTDHLGGIALPEVIRTAIPELANDIPSLPVRQGWGLGFHLTLEDVPTMRRAGTGDWAGLFNCYYWVDRTTGVAAAFMTQVLPFFDERIVQTALGVEAAVYASVAAAA